MNLDTTTCPAESVGVRCQLERGHNSPHRCEDRSGVTTWEPRYVGELRRQLIDGPWRWRAMLEDVLEDLGPALSSEAIAAAREAVKEPVE